MGYRAELPCGCRLGADGELCNTARWLEERIGQLKIEEASRNPYAAGKRRRIEAELHHHLYSQEAEILDGPPRLVGAR